MGLLVAAGAVEPVCLLPAKLQSGNGYFQNNLASRRLSVLRFKHFALWSEMNDSTPDL
jgi:hypothetical protein